jgi:hypothetical protein
LVFGLPRERHRSLGKNCCDLSGIGDGRFMLLHMLVSFSYQAATAPRQRKWRRPVRDEAVRDQRLSYGKQIPLKKLQRARYSEYLTRQLSSRRITDWKWRLSFRMSEDGVCAYQKPLPFCPNAVRACAIV